jgi:leucyl aminopeptidase (aminopeptidase T)
MKRDIEKTISTIYQTNLQVKQRERVLIFTDDTTPQLQDLARKVATKSHEFSNHSCFTVFSSTKSHGAEPPEILWNAAFGNNIVTSLKIKKIFISLLQKKNTSKQNKIIENTVKRFKKDAVDVVIALSYYSTSHTKFRDLLTSICGTRYASMPLFDFTMLTGAMRVNWRTMSERTKKIRKRVHSSETIELETSNGTHIIMSKKGRRTQADTGIINKRGTFSNLPAGEVFFAPLEGTAEGRLVLEWAPTHKLRNPIILLVRKGRVYSIKGKGAYSEYLKRKISERSENANIAELGIGTNDKAKRPDNILESEKILGTVHIALGDNSSFGGKVRTPFHQDFIFFQPTLSLIYKNGKRDALIRRGRLH